MIENELRQLISKAKACLTDLCPYTTHVAQLALEDMIQQAEAAVAQDENDKNDESGVLPFTTKREFGNWHWNKEDACQFAKKRYTMASVWFEPGKGLQYIWIRGCVGMVSNAGFAKVACCF